jgi:two-component system chemotaxis sensor kinase CheA
MLTDEEIMTQVLAAFQAEQSEHRQSIAHILLELERDPNHPQRRTLLDQLFRNAHSLKGGARAAGQFEVEQLAHAIEELFSAVRQETVALCPEVCDPLYAALDAIGVMMGQVAAGQPISLDPYLPFLAALDELVLGAGASEPPALSGPDAIVVESRVPDHSTGKDGAPSPVLSIQPLYGADGSQMFPAPGVTSAVQRFEPEPQLEPQMADTWRDAGDTTVRLSTARLDELLQETGELITCTVRQQQRAQDAQQLLGAFDRWRRTWRAIRPVYARLQHHAPEMTPTVHYLPNHECSTTMTTLAADHETTVLVNALIQAHELIGELEQQLGRQVREMVEDSSRLESVTERLYTQVRRTRMLPLATLWSPVRLQVRDMARAAGKEVALVLDDGGAEADRQVLDQLREVLLHLLRNAVDHGIETSAQRLAQGKAAEGRLTLCGNVRGDRLVVTLSDDGAGLDLPAIRERALTNRLLADGELAQMTPADLAELIFRPGFSTRTTVSALSGRGVGLDIVRSQVERMHGRVSVQSTPGVGCIFTISVPLSLTSAQGLLFQADDALYALPIESLERIITVATGSIQMLEGRAMLAVDRRPVPLAHLGDVLHGASAGSKVRSGHADLALLLSIGERRVACLVDMVLGEQELVVQRLPVPLQRVRYFAGATILADGRVAPILDVVDLVRGVLGTRSTIDTGAAAARPKRRPRILVVDDSITTRTLEKNILTAAGYEVHLAADGAQALTLLQHLFNRGGCDLLLSDVDMPQLNGFELTAQVRQDAALRHLPVVLMTSLDTPADRERGIAAGADAYLVKRGFDQRRLLDLIASLL